MIFHNLVGVRIRKWYGEREKEKEREWECHVNLGDEHSVLNKMSCLMPKHVDNWAMLRLSYFIIPIALWKVKFL